MQLRTTPACTLVLLAVLTLSALSPSAHGQDDDLGALAGRWLYVQDVTEGRPSEEQQPPMSVTFGLRIDADAFVVERGGGREDRVALDGSVEEKPGSSSITRTSGEPIDGGFRFDTRIVRTADDSLIAFIRKEFRATPEGLEVHVVVGDPPQMDSRALYKHPEDIALPWPAEARIDDLAWLAGAWVGDTGKSSVEERWSPPGGGAMLGTSRTISHARGSMRAFEYLRVVERDGGLVYVAQPNGGTATEFVLTQLHRQRAVFENPRHDSPQRIVYELADDGVLSASIGFMHGGRPTVFEFSAEGG